MYDRLRRPTGLVEQTRWLFFGTALLSLAVTVPAIVPEGTRGTILLALVATGVLVACWLHRYLTRSCPVGLDVVEACAVLAFAISCPSPVAAYGFVISGAWFRAAYGSTWRAFWHTLGGAAGILLALVLWRLVPGHLAATPAPPVLGVLPILLLTFAVSRHLVAGLFAREQAQLRDDALATLGTRLLGATDRDTIRLQAWEAVVAVCAATPGLHALSAVGGSDEHLQVRRWTGSLGTPPDTLRRTCLPAAGGADGPAPLADPRELPADRESGRPLTWLGLRLPQQPHNWLLLGSEGPPPAEAVVAITSLLNQVALALRNSDAHHDLTTQALTDGLTGLANRGAFNVALELAVAGQEPLVSVLFLDLDDFKTVNDGLGHAAGDELLRLVAARLREAVRAGDVCARLGGDEFAVLLADGNAAAVGQRLVEMISATVQLAAGSAQIGASIGFALAEPGLSAGQLLQRADIAMYAAKAQGKNRVQAFDPGLLQPGARAVDVVRPRRPVVHVR